MSLLLRATVVGALGYGAYQLFAKGRTRRDEAGRALPDPGAAVETETFAEADEAGDDDAAHEVTAEPTNEFEARLAAVEAGAEATPAAPDFAGALDRLIEGARERGEYSVDVTAAQLRRLVGGYAGDADGVQAACAVMRQHLKPGDRIVKEPKSGAGATFTVRYHPGN